MKIKVDKSEWQKVRLGDVAFEYSKRINNPSESEYDRFIGSSNIGQWDFRVKSWESTSSVTSAMKLFEKNDYLLVRRSLYASDFRERAPRAHFNGVCSGDILTIKENPKYVVDGFLIGVLNSAPLWKYVVANGSGSITRRIHWKDLADYEFLLPPKDQQQQIAELLWAGDEMIEKELQVLTELKKYYDIKRHKLLNGHDLIEGEGEIPLDWKKYRIEEISKVIDYRGKTPIKSEKGIRLITAKNVREGWLDRYPEEFIYETDYDSWMRRGIPKKGDILFTTEAPLGNVALVDIDEKFALAQRIICLQPNELIHGNFLKYALDNSAVKREIFSKATGTTVMGIRSSLLKKLLLLIPPISQQKFIISILSVLDSSISKIESEILQSKALQKALINQFF